MNRLVNAEDLRLDIKHEITGGRIAFICHSCKSMRFWISESERTSRLSGGKTMHICMQGESESLSRGDQYHKPEVNLIRLRLRLSCTYLLVLNVQSRCNSLSGFRNHAAHGHHSPRWRLQATNHQNARLYSFSNPSWPRSGSEARKSV